MKADAAAKMPGRKGQNMDSLTIMALSKCVKDKDAKTAREALTPGEHEVDCFVRITGTLDVAADTEKTSTSSIISEDALIVALKLAGCTRERAAEIIRDVTAQCIGKDPKEAKAARKAMVEEFDPDGTVTAIFDEIKASLPKTQVKGAVKFAGAVVEVRAEQADAAVA